MAKKAAGNTNKQKSFNLAGKGQIQYNNPTSSFHPQTFRGSGPDGAGRSVGFIKNSYTIFTDGLDGEGPNPYAISQASRVDSSMQSLANNQLSSLSYLFNYLKKLAEKERKKEIKYLEKKLKWLKENKPEEFESTRTTEALEEILQGLEKGNTETLSSAYTVLLNPTGYDKLIEELESKENHFGLQHSNVVYGPMGQTLLSRIVDRVMDEEGLAELLHIDDTGKLTTSNKKLTNQLIDKIITEYVQVVGDNLKGQVKNLRAFKKEVRDNLIFGAEAEGLKFNKNSRELRSLLNRSKRESTSGWSEEDKEKLSKARRSMVSKAIKDNKTGKLKARDPGAVIKETLMKSIRQNLYEAIEMLANSRADKLGMIGIHTGSHLADREQRTGEVERGKKVTTDFLMLDLINKNFDAKVLNNAIDSFLFQDQEGIDKALKAAAKSTKTLEQIEKRYKDMFALHVNTKGYFSNFNLSVVNKRTLNSLTKGVNDIAKSFYEASNEAIGGRASYHKNRVGAAFDRFIFMLNNTMDGAYFAKDKEKLESLISYNCCIWMWDGMLESVKSIEGKENGINHIHLFQSGGEFFTVSDLLNEIINEFENHFKSASPDFFIESELFPAEFNANDVYRELKNLYPLTSFTIKNKDKETNYDTTQKVLQRRWLVMRNLSLKGTKFSVKFRQGQIDKLMGRLSLLNFGKKF